MSWHDPHAIARFEAARAARRTWQKRTGPQSRKARKEEEMKFAGRAVRNDARGTLKDFDAWALRRVGPVNSTGLDDMPGDLKLQEGVAVTYRSQLRYTQAPEDAITIDMFDSVIEMPAEFSTGTGRRDLIRRTETFHTSMVLREELPEFFTGKMDTLYVALKSCVPEKAGAGFSVSIPGVGIAFASGAMWIIITKEDLSGTRWEPMAACS